IWEDDFDAVGPADAAVRNHGDGGRGGDGSPSSRRVVVADLEGEVTGGQGADGSVDVHDDAVEALAVGGVVSQGGRPAGEEGGLVGGDGAIVADGIDEGVVAVKGR